jgi:hypothetical protein
MEPGDPVLLQPCGELVHVGYDRLVRLRLNSDANKCKSLTAFPGIEDFTAVILLQNDPMAGSDFYGYSPLLSANTAWLFSRVWMGHFGASETELTHALEVANLHRQIDVVCWLETASVLLARFAGGGAASLDHARRAVESAEKAGTSFPACLLAGHSEWLMASAEIG